MVVAVVGTLINLVFDPIFMFVLDFGIRGAGYAVFGRVIEGMEIVDAIEEARAHGDLSEKPGWVRWSLHPTMTDEEVDTMIDALNDIVSNIKKYEKDYEYVNRTNTFWHKDEKDDQELLNRWFTLEHE